MHEYGLTRDVLSMALGKAGEAKASRITRINLVIGDLSGVADESVRFYFDFLTKDTIADKAALSFVKKPVTLRCRACKKIFSPADIDWTCPSCGELTAEIVSGRECYMESIEVE
jgi:hydrogenase nickel incorporation protein HypA/HybF